MKWFLTLSAVLALAAAVAGPFLALLTLLQLR